MNSNIKTTHVVTDAVVISLVEVAKTDSLLVDMKSIMVDRVKEYKKIGPVVAAIRDSDTLGIGGVGQIHTGVGTAWLLVSKEFLKYPKALLTLSRQIIAEAFDGLNLHRLQIDVDPKYKENIRFAKRLGFKFEGTMLQYGTRGEDYCRFVQLRGYDK